MNPRSMRTIALAALPLILMLAGCEPTNQGYEPRQPVAYSHAVHAGSLELACTYCHYAAERGPFAGIPPSSICMNCHAQIKPQSDEVLKVVAALEQQEPIRWVRVHQLPDHAAFDHSAHVGAGEIDCQTCHGEVQGMGIVRQENSLTMGWCLSCHRQPPTAGAVATSLPGDPAIASRTSLTDCATCHH